MLMYVKLMCVLVLGSYVNVSIFFMNHSNCGLGSYVGMFVLHTYEGYSEIVFIYVDVVCVCV